MTFQVVPQLAQLQQLGARHQPDGRPGSVQDRSGVALGEHEPVVVGVVRVQRVEAHLREEKRRDQIRG